MDKAIKDVIKENTQRFPLKKTKNKHTNVLMGGHDGRHQIGLR
jgi:hypothetical protein